MKPLNEARRPDRADRSASTRLRVIHHHRRPNPTDFSIERLFCDIRKHLDPEIACQPVTGPFRSRGFWRRALNCARASLTTAQVHHVTGDVHYLVAALPADRTVLTIHDLGTLERLRGTKQWLYRKLWIEVPVRRASVVTTISQATRGRLLEVVDVDPAKVIVIPDCVSDDFQPAPQPFRADKPRILQVGSRPNKNLERVAEALAGIPSHLDIIGRLTPHQRDVLHRYRIEYSSCSDLSDPEVVERYRACDVVVLASTYEGFGLPIVEANATGRPVVTSNILSMPEVAGDAACLVDPFDVGSIRAGIRRVVDDANYRAELIDKGFENVVRFRPDVVAAQYAELYLRLARNAWSVGPSGPLRIH